MSKETIENIIEKKVDDILAARALDQASIAPQPEISEELQRRLDLLEQKIEGKDDGREQGLTFLLMAKQHAVRGEHASALRMYTLAKTYFPDNRKLDSKIEKLRETIQEKKDSLREGKVEWSAVPRKDRTAASLAPRPRPKSQPLEALDADYQDKEVDGQDFDSDASFRYRSKAKKARPKTVPNGLAGMESEKSQTPRTKRLLKIVNGRDASEIRLLKGVGVKKAEAIIEALCAGEEGEGGVKEVRSLEQLGRLKGVSGKTVEAMRFGL